jgi:hypothetical protein
VFVCVDLRQQPPVISLEEPEDFGRFHVSVLGGDPAGDVGTLRTALEATGTGRVAGSDEAFVDIGALRRLAHGRVGEGWDGRLDEMIAFARTKGWVDPTGEAVQAHCEWSPSA